MEKNNFDSLAILSELNAHRNACTLFIDHDGEPIASSLDLYPWSLNAAPWPRRRSVRAGRVLHGSKKLEGIDLCVKESHSNLAFKKLLESTDLSSPRLRLREQARSDSPEVDPLLRSRTVHWSLPLVRDDGPEYNDSRESRCIVGMDYGKCCLKHDTPLESTSLQTFLQLNETSCLKHLMWANRSAFQLRRRYLLRLGIPASSLMSLADSSIFSRESNDKREVTKHLRAPSSPTMIMERRKSPRNDSSSSQNSMFWPLTFSWNKRLRLGDSLRMDGNDDAAEVSTKHGEYLDDPARAEMDFLNGWSV
ncbi:hypothetical protein GUITHDRAFT_154979 [Guillardia theta CCMP2712]|uniref:Uncharacterized protein n=2 Tax=Guillardia theta TaxID=55529 RepID=L1ING8_GUITC|nr:hypothetical protein GUITHDRAFT_154979 [Guillardia theta CCMP2712]EKX37345.1 hypothetical protein GUITHDRAFT_154979 [Guillardia theta CCMP2712]|mmetsp:Transcript_14328/g.48978  ORF Transcript_14328/g.48978 Transcript_14328/m.48978 type:complete len:307 (+) Transcript_14328:148-1068(+)|eukprot:XP_005824325.1 hypothetical protein GUITHDRAFT_154979 [Guillardia theta CCMP2712]